MATSRGEVVLTIQKVRDVLGRKGFPPLLRALAIRKHRYTRELRFRVADAVTTPAASYREACRTVGKATRLRIPPRTAWNFVQEVAPGVEQELKAHPMTVTDPVHPADGKEGGTRRKGAPRPGPWGGRPGPRDPPDAGGGGGGQRRP